MDLRAFFYTLFIVSLVSCHTLEQIDNSIVALENGQYLIANSHLSFVVDAQVGARIVSVKCDGMEILLQEREGLLNWGSTLWFAPQSRWNWPPPAAIHTGKYIAKIHDNKLIMEGETDAIFGFRATKTFSFDTAANCLTIDYQIFNVADSTQHVGLWEVSCVPAGGIVFFPLGTVPNESESNLFMEDKNGIGFFLYEPEKLQSWQKVFNNVAEGWLAHVSSSNVLFIKSFETVPAGDIAPGQGNVEFYVSKDNEYMELENHGKYVLLEPGKSLTYQVKWYIESLPETMSADNFNTLVDMVRSKIQ